MGQQPAETSERKLTSIVDEFVGYDGCPFCAGSGHVCETHTRPWDEGDGCCGAPGMPCPPCAERRRLEQLAAR